MAYNIYNGFVDNDQMKRSQENSLNPAADQDPITG